MIRRNFLKTLLAAVGLSHKLPEILANEEKQHDGGVIKAETELLPSEHIDYIPVDSTFDTNIQSEIKLRIYNDDLSELYNNIGDAKKMKIRFCDGSVIKYEGYLISMDSTFFSEGYFYTDISICVTNHERSEYMISNKINKPFDRTCLFIDEYKYYIDEFSFEMYNNHYGRYQ